MRERPGDLSDPKARNPEFPRLLTAFVQGGVSVPPERLIATDLGGTLLRDDKSVSPRTVAALAAAEEAGIEVFSATGRPGASVVAIVVLGRHLNIDCGNMATHVEQVRLRRFSWGICALRNWNHA